MLTNQAYEIALILREAQSFGIAVREGEGATGFDIGYGIYVSTGDNTRITLFSDADKNELYDVSDPIVREFVLNRGSTISEFCVSTGGTETCSGAGVNNMSVAFVRPDPDAKIHANGSAATGYQSASIEIISPDGDTKRVVAFSTGQIAVEE